MGGWGSLLFRGLTLSRYMRHQGGIQGLNRGGRGLGGGVRNCPNQLKNTLLFQFMDEIICTGRTMDIQKNNKN